jgi:hypothetical protein
MGQDLWLRHDDYKPTIAGMRAFARQMGVQALGGRTVVGSP